MSDVEVGFHGFPCNENDVFSGSSGSENDASDEDCNYVPSESSSEDSEDERQTEGTSEHDPGVSRRVDRPNWASRPNDNQPQLPLFESPCGVNVQLDNDCTEFDCFSLFFDSEMLKSVKVETNRYAGAKITEMKRKKSLKEKSIWHKWSGLKIHEVYWFFSIIVHMCVVKLPKISDYWSTDPFMSTSWVSKLLSRDRFTSILFMLHLNDNSTFVKKGEPGHDPLHKIRPYFDSFMRKCKMNFNPYFNLTIDEGICPFRGRVGFKVYMKNKPNKYGLKLYLLCDSFSGYVLSCEIYTGKATNVDNTILSLVGRLCHDYLGKGHCIYMDRFYTSPALLDFLWENKTLAVGTVMKNRRGLPDNMKTVKLKKGEIQYWRLDHILAVKWKSTRDVYCLSTQHRATSTEISARTRQGLTNIRKPDVIIDYNQNKTGVDRVDQLSSYYPFNRKTLKWWKKIFFHLFVMSIVNSWVLFKEATGKKPSLVDFMKALGKQLADRGGMESVQDASCRASSSADRTFGRHFPAKIPPTACKMNATRCCKVCGDRGKKETGKRVRKETRWWCEQCNVGLCVPDCFQQYHTRINY